MLLLLLILLLFLFRLLLLLFDWLELERQGKSEKDAQHIHDRFPKEEKQSCHLAAQSSLNSSARDRPNSPKSPSDRPS